MKRKTTIFKKDEQNNDKANRLANHDEEENRFQTFSQFIQSR